MRFAPTPRPRLSVRLRRAAALAMIALQGAGVLSPLAQTVHPERLQAHVESRGATHPNGHNEGTCALGAAQSAHHAIPVSPCDVSAAPGHQSARTLSAFAAPASDVGPTNLSRAPPLAG